MSENTQNSALLYTLLSVALVFIILLAMKEAAYIVNMVLISLILILLGVPLLQALKRRGFSDVSSVVLIIALYLLIIAGFIFLIYQSFEMLLVNMPKYEGLFQERLSGLIALLGSFGVDADLLLSYIKPDWDAISRIMIGVVSGGSQLAMNAFFIVVITTFGLLDVPKMPARINRIYGENSGKIESVKSIIHNMITWLVVKTKTNVVLGVSFGGMLYALGIDLAIFWGVMTVLLSYIPYIGLMIVAIPAIFLAWLQLGLWGVVIVAAGICVINAVVENFVFSKFAADSFNMPGLIVILTLVLWSWVLGPIGLLLSVPFTVILIALLEANKDTKWIVTLMGVDKEKFE
ncbi:AI-2E family transporter [Methanoplanus endosymbiosus]|uniref:AI-2E family transporter n=1 Tax=Methanoplanus endosymbiosus TaxID=33865 RepID=A0A9E7PNW2_9EURY|nr:AI-2E family transporter [Methanoplanus endosymbiosus]UUX92166.1 AI-2E family transporter [Methanoplanus endosymbiosus]